MTCPSMKSSTPPRRSIDVRWGIACLFVIASIAVGAAPPTTTKPAPPDEWTRPAQEAARQKRLAAFAGEVEPRLKHLLGNVNQGDLDHLIRLAMLREFGRYFARVENPDEGQLDTLAWLPTQPRLMTQLMLSVSLADPPDRVLEVLRSLRADFRKDLDDNAELAAATCVVWDSPERFGTEEDSKINPAEICRVFGYFLKQFARQRGDAQKLPVDALVHVVDINLSEAEMQWAAKRYGAGAANVAAIMNDVPYREGVAYEKTAGEPNENSYILPNIFRNGGTSDAAAYYASEIAKLGGVPTAVCRAVGVTDGVPIAWVASMAGGAKPVWNLNSARYAEYLGWPGETTDPQTGQAISDSELAFTSALFATPPRERLASVAIFKSLDLLDARQSPVLLERAIELSVGNARAWYAYAGLAAEGKLTDDQLKSFEKLTVSRLKDYPHFALLVRLRALQGRGTLEFADGMERILTDFAQRPDVVALALLARADWERADKRDPEAIATLVELLRKQGASPSVAWMAVARLEGLLRGTDDAPKLLEVYENVFNALPRPPQTLYGRSFPYYRIGEKYAALLDEMKQQQQAAAVRSKYQFVVRDR